MNKNRFSILILVVLALSTLSFVNAPKDQSKYKITIKGVHRDFLSTGLKSSEFGNLKIESNDTNVKIESFQVTLARGNRAVDVTEVEGSSCDLKKFVNLARPGDRMVLEVISLKGADASPESSILVFTVN